MRLIYQNTFFFLLCLGIASSCHKEDQNKEIKSVQLGNVELHYKIAGEGFPLILVHGSLVDFLYWKNQDSLLSKGYQLITYSRRYNYPNTNKPEPNHSALVEANDLLALMDKLKIEQAYILGHSYGGYTAFLFSLAHPDRVKKLILAEPPLLKWLSEIPTGKEKLKDFMENIWGPIGKAFLKNGERAGLDTTTRRWLKTPLDSVPQEMKEEMFRNVKEWVALSTSDDAFPLVSIERVKEFTIPTLLLSGGLNTGNRDDLIVEELARILPHNKRVIIKNAGHEMFVDNPEESNQAIINFLKREE